MKNVKEVKIRDKRGNIVISPGLKVRHKKSKFEYTVNKVVKGKDGKLVVLLSSPTKPRVEPAKSKNLLSDSEPTPQNRYSVDEDEDISSYYEVPEKEPKSSEDLLAVPEKEFEEEYKVND